ncbi:hypothetical protein Tco_1446221 [Tanacetum coccineum]
MFLRLCYLLKRGCALPLVLDMRSRSVHLLLLLGLLEALKQIMVLLALWMPRLDVTQIGYRITDVWVDPDEIAEDIPATDVVELGQRMTDFVTTVRQDTYEIYGRLDDAQDDRLLMSSQLNSLRRDRRSHARTARLMKSEARASHEAWETNTARKGIDSAEDITDLDGSITESAETR